MVLKPIVNLVTLPYYRMFQFNTYQPIILIAAYTSTPGKHHKVLYHLDRWRTLKLAELQFISIGVSHFHSPECSSYSVSPLFGLQPRIDIDPECHSSCRHYRFLLLERHW